MYSRHRAAVNRNIVRIMVTTESTPRPCVTIARNARVAIQPDAPVPKGGGGGGFDPHALPEASIAACINGDAQS
jgi:uncharacterized OsmC-like protein